MHLKVRTLWGGRTGAATGRQAGRKRGRIIFPRQRQSPPRGPTCGVHGMWVGGTQSWLCQNVPLIRTHRERPEQRARTGLLLYPFSNPPVPPQWGKQDSSWTIFSTKWKTREKSARLGKAPSAHLKSRAAGGSCQAGSRSG